MSRGATALTARGIGLIVLFFIFAIGNISHAQTGACCLDNGACIDDLTLSQCAVVAGTWMGEGTTCYDTECSGACCMPDSSCEDSYGRTQCEDAGGTYQGHGTTCSEVVCIPPEPAPALTNWGLLVLLILLLLAGIIIIRRRRETVRE